MAPTPGAAPALPLPLPLPLALPLPLPPFPPVVTIDSDPGSRPSCSWRGTSSEAESSWAAERLSSANTSRTVEAPGWSHWRLTLCERCGDRLSRRPRRAARARHSHRGGRAIRAAHRSRSIRESPVSPRGFEPRSEARRSRCSCRLQGDHVYRGSEMARLCDRARELRERVAR